MNYCLRYITLIREYNSENIRSITLKVLKEYDISGDQIGYFMLDNTSSNDTAVNFILKGLCLLKNLK
jgi:hypothetical protein